MTIQGMRNLVSTSLAIGLLLSHWIPAHSDEPGTSPNQRVALEGQPNFRDIGGYKTKNGKTVKPGLVYRSGELPRLTDNDLAKLKQLGIKTVVNFLTDAETKDRGKDRLPEGVREVLQPIESDDGLVGAANQARKTADFSKVPPDLNPQFHRILVNDATKQYARLLKEVAQADEPIVFHCSHGIHRTGTATAILLWTLGVPWETIREDYLLSNECRKVEIEKRISQLRQLAANNQEVRPEEVDMTNINAFYILQGNYIDATRDEILKKYGSIDGYLNKGLGLTKRDIQKLRERLRE
jgi:protein-tyrosine phosphatase